MKKLICYLLVYLFCQLIPLNAFAVVVGYSRTFGGGPGPTTPDFEYDLDDNAANTTITATEGTDGNLFEGGVGGINTSTVYSADGPSFHLNNGGSNSTQIIRTGDLSDTAFEDNVFTIQWDMKSSTSFTAANERIISNDVTEAQLMFISASDTSINIYIGGSNEGNFTVDDMAAGTWLTYRVVVDTGATNTITVYQGADEDNLVSKSTTTDTLTAIAITDNWTCWVGGNGSSTKTRDAQHRNLKIWYTAETP